MSKNSGSFPNWAIYLSGSSGQGKLWSEFSINASVSCSYSSSTVFQTGSVYQVDVRILPGVSASGIYVNGQSEGGAFGNGGGSLSNTGSLFVGNFSQNNTQNFSGSIYTIKSYTVQSLTQPPLNYNVTATRFSKPFLPYVAPTFELLVVAGGGAGGNGNSGGGGGAGGLQYVSNYTPIVGNNTVVVGNSGPGANGQNSLFSTIISIGGGKGGNFTNAGNTGGSGGGGGGSITSGGPGISGQGNNGGNSTSNSWQTSGGGGGAGSAGTPNNGNSRSGTGGSGSYIDSFAAIGGSPVGWFAGGGGGGSTTNAFGFGGIGGGANGTGSAVGPTGSANTGGGGGGSGNSTGGAGGSGIVAIRYSGAPIALGGEITQSAGFTYHVFRTVGTSSFTIF
jgi:hypothetical protein